MILGTETLGWVEVHPLVPYSDAHTETLAQESTALAGRITQNILGFRRVWTVSTAPLSDRLWADVVRLRQIGLGPFWFFDDTLTNLLTREARVMRGWRNGATTVTVGAGLRLPIPAGGTLTQGDTTTVDRTVLAVVTPGEFLTVAATFRATTTATVSVGLRWYTAAGAFISATAVSGAATTTDNRLVGPLTPPATAAYAMAYVTASAAATVTGVSILPGAGFDLGGGWTVVHITDVSEVHHNSMMRSATLSVREVD